MFDTPTIAQLRETADELGMTLTDDYLEATQRIVAPMVKAYQVLDGVPDELPQMRYPRTPGHRPTPEENPHGAWYVKTDIKGAKHGKLAGHRVAVKDNICVAGVPMMNGASVLDGEMPAIELPIIAELVAVVVAAGTPAAAPEVTVAPWAHAFAASVASFAAE